MSQDIIAKATELGEKVGPVSEEFSQMKRYDHGILPTLRQIAGYEDPMGVGTYTHAPDEESQILLDEVLDAFWDAARGS